LDHFSQTQRSPGYPGLLEFIGEDLRRDSDYFRRIDDDEAAMLATILEADNARNLRKEGVILATADVQARLQRCAALTNDDAAAQDCLAAEYLYTEPLRV
jgi:hypothetical protein